MTDIDNCLNGVPSVCMNVTCNNKCNKMYIMKLGSQNIIHYFCDKHYQQFMDEVLGGYDD